MDDDLLTLLRKNKIFGTLTKRTLRTLLPKFERIELEKDEVLYYQGDPSDSIEILLEGKLAAILTTYTGETKTAGHIEPGETVGEIGALSGEPRTTTVIAVKHSIMFKLHSEIFIELCQQYSSVLYEVVNPIVTRSHQLIQIISSEKFKKHVVIAPANDEVSLAIFSDKLNELLEGVTSTIFLSDYNDEIANATPQKIQALLNEAKAKNIKKAKQKIIYLIKDHKSALAKFCLPEAEMIYVVTHENAPVILSNIMHEKINQLKFSAKMAAELIILHDDDTKLPTKTAAWLELADFGLHHHIRINQNKDYYRLLRFIRNKAVGLVLSGGGTRGWGHIGAIKALIEAGIPIDAVGGTSVGSIIAASYAITESYEGTLTQFREIIENSRNSVSWRSFTWPAISLFNAKGLTHIIQKVFNDIQIEDLWLPYYCVSTNLAKNAETVHRKGLLWEQIRCSIALPGIIPPMLLNGELHFDGGLLNNLPVDVMRKTVGLRGNVVAVELGGNIKDEHKYSFPPVLTFWQALLGELGIAYEYKFPHFIDTFLKSLLAGSSLKAQLNGLAANILVNLDLSRYPMLHSNKKQENKIIEIGYETTLHQIKNMKRKSK